MSKNNGKNGSNGKQHPTKKVEVDENGKPISKLWGRHYGPSFLNVLLCACIVLFCPIFAIYSTLSCRYFECSLVEPVMKHGLYLYDFLPTFEWESIQIYFIWLAFQIVLYMILPSKIAQGQVTPAGHILDYKVNGLFAYVVSLAVYGAGSWLGWWKASLIFDHWEGLLIATNVYGYFLSCFAYFKAHFFPTHPDDCKFSGSYIYDFYMGVELNPRIGKMFDFKLFHNGRPGIIAWSIINLSHTAAQYYRFGYITNSIVLVNYIQALYVIDFFYNEDWYLRTIDIAHDHFGFYLSWGDSVWLPFMYTIQAQYLARFPVQLNNFVAIGIFLFANLGYYIFRTANHQKDILRKTKGECLIWGKKPSFIRARYTSSDGVEHESLLLTDGFWAYSRHFNYVGDLIMSFCMCCVCGYTHILPHFYIVYMTILLCHRIWRDHERCSNKYGKYWDEYCKKVPQKLIPYIF